MGRPSALLLLSALLLATAAVSPVAAKKRTYNADEPRPQPAFVPALVFVLVVLLISAGASFAASRHEEDNATPHEWQDEELRTTHSETASTSTQISMWHDVVFRLVTLRHHSYSLAIAKSAGSQAAATCDAVAKALARTCAADGHASPVYASLLRECMEGVGVSGLHAFLKSYKAGVVQSVRGYVLSTLTGGFDPEMGVSLARGGDEGSASVQPSLGNSLAPAHGVGSVVFDAGRATRDILIRICDTYANMPPSLALMTAVTFELRGGTKSGHAAAVEFLFLDVFAHSLRSGVSIFTKKYGQLTDDKLTAVASKIEEFVVATYGVNTDVKRMDDEDDPLDNTGGGVLGVSVIRRVDDCIKILQQTQLRTPEVRYRKDKHSLEVLYEFIQANGPAIEAHVTQSRGAGMDYRRRLVEVHRAVGRAPYTKQRVHGVMDNVNKNMVALAQSSAVSWPNMLENSTHTSEEAFSHFDENSVSAFSFTSSTDSDGENELRLTPLALSGGSNGSMPRARSPYRPIPTPTADGNNTNPLYDDSDQPEWSSSGDI